MIVEILNRQSNVQLSLQKIIHQSLLLNKYGNLSEQDFKKVLDKHQDKYQRVKLDKNKKRPQKRRISYVNEINTDENLMIPITDKPNVFTIFRPLKNLSKLDSLKKPKSADDPVSSKHRITVFDFFRPQEQLYFLSAEAKRVVVIDKKVIDNKIEKNDKKTKNKNSKKTKNPTPKLKKS